MAGTLSVQKIQGLASSATPTVVEVSNGHALHANTLKGTTTAGSITVQGEGSNTTNLQQGLIKCWSTVEMDNSNNIPDSFNSSGITDNGSGTPQFTFINSMATVAAYVLAGAGNDATMISEQGAAADARSASLFTGSIKTRQRAHDASVADGHVMIMIAGDLA